MKIEKYLILNKYLLSIFGVSDFKDLQVKLKMCKLELIVMVGVYIEPEFKRLMES